MTVVEDQDIAGPRSADGLHYVYGVVRAGHPVPPQDGVLAGRVGLVSTGEVAALVSSVPDTTVRAKRRDLLAHSDVLQAAFAHGVILPLRFGTVFGDEDDVVSSFLEPRAGELLDLLDRFEGLCEMRLKVAYRDEEAILADIVKSDQDVGRLRAQARPERQGSHAGLVQLGELVADRYARRRAADAEAIVARLGGVAVRVHGDEPDDPLVVTKASFLLASSERKAFDELLDSVALSSRHLLQFTCTGPLPPHSFVSLGGREEI